MKIPEEMEKVRQYINQSEYHKAKVLLDKLKRTDYLYDDTVAILDASICEALDDREGMFCAIERGLQYACDNYELYYMLGYYYFPVNQNQAWLCFQNALYYCEGEEEKRVIEADMERLKTLGQTQVKGTSIIIVSYNASYLMQKNIESIRQTLPQGTYRIVVVDNGSTDGILQWLQEQRDIILIQNEENEGFPHACNQGVRSVLGTEGVEDDIFLLNNDTRLAPNSLFWLKMGLYERDDVGAVGSCSNYAGNNQQVDIVFSLPKEYLEYGAKINVPLEQPYEERVRLSGFAMLIRGKVWDMTGGMDEDFSPGYFEDDDLSMKILKAGYRLVLCNNSFVYHAGSQSFSKCDNVQEILAEHHELFIQKYGFDILEYAYPDAKIISQFPFSREAEFNVLQVGSGLGADLKYINTLFPKAHAVGLETDMNLYQISRKTEAVISSVADLQNSLTQSVFHVLLIGRIAKLAKEDIEAIAKMCRKDCVVLPGVNFFVASSLEKIKLIIWDMDDTFWEGTLSEGGVKPVSRNISLVRELTDCGIINSISSKNDDEKVMEVLRKWGIDEYFVFPDINWEGKGEQIRRKLEDMGLRPENVLFLDDNPSNLEEAKYYNKGIMVGEPYQIPALAEYVRRLDKTDIEHNRLKHYHILEKKRGVQKEFDSKEDFLFYSGIQVEVRNDCLNEIDRIAELVARTNQLNFTKVRDSKDELRALLITPQIDKGYIKVKDRFGDYGIVGFYCFDKDNHNIRHFLFSCRVIGMGIEQCIYNMLGMPPVKVVEPVSMELTKNARTPWIHVRVGTMESAKNLKEYQEKSKDNRVKILLKGPCDMSAIESYLSGGNIITEFNYVNERGFITTGQNHSMHIWESAVYSEQQIEEILKDVPFITKGDFETRIFKEEFHVICYSLLTDCSAGLYRNKKTGTYISFGGRNFSLTAPENWEGYMNGSIVNHAFPFTEEIIRKFSENWEFVGATSEEDLLRNLDYIYCHVLGKPTFILLLGSEIEYEGIDKEFAGHAVYHKEVNDLVKKYVADKERIKVIEMTDYIKSQDDYTDCINHFSRNVYYDLATEVCSCINESIRERYS